MAHHVNRTPTVNLLGGPGSHAPGRRPGGRSEGAADRAGIPWRIVVLIAAGLVCSVLAGGALVVFLGWAPRVALGP
jgi:hypothetical protein